MTDHRTIDGAAIEQNVLAGLKPFQHATVDHVFQRMFVDDDSTTRFLVADEVGLGKTLVARGLIARTIRHLQEQGRKRIDIVYICSNADIATQNVRRLNVTGQNDFSLATRITLLPRQLHRLATNGTNFVSFTPGTSFNLVSQSGRAEERAVLFRLLEYALGRSLDEDGVYRVLRAGSQDPNFRNLVQWTPGVGPQGTGSPRPRPGGSVQAGAGRPAPDARLVPRPRRPPQRRLGRPRLARADPVHRAGAGPQLHRRPAAKSGHPRRVPALP